MSKLYHKQNTSLESQSSHDLLLWTEIQEIHEIEQTSKCVVHMGAA